MCGSPPGGQHLGQFDTHPGGQGLLAIGGKDLVRTAQGQPGTHLGGLLTDEGRPQAEFPVSLQVRTLDVEPPGHDEFLVGVDELGVTHVHGEVVAIGAHPVG